MSIELMISEHPLVGAGYNATLGHAVRSAIDCAAICASCADACLAEEMDMSQCIRTCLDCADICAEECAKHRTAHCARCAQICKECSQACRTAIEDLDAEIGAEF